MCVLLYSGLQKAWNDAGSSSNRPEYVLFSATGGSTSYVIAVYEDIAYLFAASGVGGAINNYTAMNPKTYASAALCSWTVNTYTTTVDGDDLTVWSVTLDNDSMTAISSGFTSPFADDSGYTFAENTTRLEEMTKTADGQYWMDAEGWTNTSQNVWRTTNKWNTIVEYTSAAVTKTWDDHDDEQGIRPDDQTGVTVTLWQRDTETGDVINRKTVTLNVSNGWSYDTTDDPALVLYLKNDNGYEYEYYWTEEDAGGSSTVPAGYTQTSSYYYDEIDNVWYTSITNSTTVTTPVTVTKVWSDDDNAQQIRPDVLYVRLYIENSDNSLTWVDVTGEAVTASTTADTAVALTSAGGWTATLSGLPKYNSSSTEIAYKFVEVTSAATLIVGGQAVNVTAADVSWYTANKTSGYSYTSTFAASATGTKPTITTITNTHTPNGSITVSKKALATDVTSYNTVYGTDPEFTFVIKYEDGSTEEITLTIPAATANDRKDAQGYVTVSQTFENLEYGTYEIMETTNDTQTKGWEFSTLTCTNGTAYVDEEEARFVLDKDNITASFEAVFTDTFAPTGEITITKKISAEQLAAYLGNYSTAGDPYVSFTLYTTDDEEVSTKTVTFTADEIAANTADGYVTLEAVFTDVEPGDYYVTESGMPSQWGFVGISDITNGKLYASGASKVYFSITKTTASRTFEATFTDQYLTGDITVTKQVSAEEVAASGEDLEVTFTLYASTGAVLDEKTATISLSSCTNQASGTLAAVSVTFENLEPGKYTLEESGATEGWEFVEVSSTTNGTIGTGNDANTVTFEITEDNCSQAFAATYVNERSNGKITVIKYDSTGTTPLDGVTYTLYDANGEVVESRTTGEDGDGTVVFGDLKAGTYRITETSTVDGYSLLANAITATIPLVITDEQIAEYAAEGIYVDTSADGAVEKDGEWWFYNLTYKVTDTATLSLPTTGSFGSVPMAVLIAGLACMAAALALVLAAVRRRRPNR